jgi:hypothetical protein
MLLLSLMVPAARAEPQTVHVQMVRTLAQAPYYIAVTNGYFEKEGLAIESSNVRSALDTIAPLAMGQLDVGIGAATSGFFNAASRNFDMRIVAAWVIRDRSCRHSRSSERRCGTTAAFAVARIFVAAKWRSMRPATSPNIFSR